MKRVRGHRVGDLLRITFGWQGMDTCTPRQGKLSTLVRTKQCYGLERQHSSVDDIGILIRAFANDA